MAGYTIQRGDTLSRLASQYGTSVSELARLNGISNPNLIRAGATINIPGYGEQVTSSAPATTPAQSSENTIENIGDEITNLLSQIKNLNTQALPTYDVLTVDQAKQQAVDQYRGQYDDLRTGLKRNLDLDSERRGIFNSPLAAGIMNEQSGRLETAYNSDIATLAQTLVQNSQNQTLARQQQDQAIRDAEINRLGSLLSALQSERAYADAKELAEQQAAMARSGGGGGGYGINSQAPSGVSQEDYAAASSWLGDVMSGKYTSKSQLTSAMNEWYKEVGSVLGNDVRDYMYNSVLNQYSGTLNSLSDPSTPKRPDGQSIYSNSVGNYYMTSDGVPATFTGYKQGKYYINGKNVTAAEYSKKTGKNEVRSKQS